MATNNNNNKATYTTINMHGLKVGMNMTIVAGTYKGHEGVFERLSGKVSVVLWIGELKKRVTIRRTSVAEIDAMEKHFQSLPVEIPQDCPCKIGQPKKTRIKEILKQIHDLHMELTLLLLDNDV